MQNINLPAINRNLAGKVTSKDPGNFSREAVERACERVGVFGDRWKQMAWYVQFSTLDFDNISDGNLLNVQEEVFAISLFYCCAPAKKFPTRAQMKLTQNEIANYLEDLVRKGVAYLGPFSFTLMVERPQYQLDNNLSRIPLEFVGPNPSEVKTLKKLDENPEEGYLPILRYHLAELLPLFANSLFRCPKCQKIFLQFRRHAKFCSRVCQSRAAMETVRKEKKVEKSKPKASTTKHRGSSSKRRK